MRQSSVKLITNTSMSSNITSPPINLLSIYAFSIQGVWTGTTAEGYFTLQGSNDSGDLGSGQAVTPPTNWTSIDGSNQVISGAPGSILYDVTETSYRWVRLLYVATSGNAVLNAVMNSKGV